MPVKIPLKALTRITRVIGEAIFPVKCPVCRSFFNNRIGPAHTEEVPGTPAFVCMPCAARISPVSPPICRCCGADFETPEGADHLCQTCILEKRPFQKARASGVYDQTLMTVIHQFKYQGKIGLAHPLGKMLLGAFFDCFAESEIDLIVPVPLHARRFRRRGFNQAYLLVKDWRRWRWTRERPIGMSRTRLTWSA